MNENQVKFLNNFKAQLKSIDLVGLMFLLKAFQNVFKNCYLIKEVNNQTLIFSIKDLRVKGSIELVGKTLTLESGKDYASIVLDEDSLALADIDNWDVIDYNEFKTIYQTHQSTFTL
jgi:hypothetical protein